MTSNLPSVPPSAEAEPAAASAPLDVIFIEGFSGETVIGIHASELHRPQPVVIDVQAGRPRVRACSTDRIGDTIDYGLVCERLRRLLVEHRLQLLEAFAQTVADILIDEFGASWVRVRVAKPRKFGDVAAVGVQIERSAEAPAPSSTRSPGGSAVLRMLGSGLVPG